MKQSIELIENQNSEPQRFAIAYVKGGVVATLNVDIKYVTTKKKDFPEGKIYSCTQINIQAEELSFEEIINIVLQYEDSIDLSELKEIYTALGIGIKETDNLETAKEKLLAIITDYDKSSAVNEITYMGTPMWIEFDLRKNITHDIKVLKAKNIDVFTFWFNGNPMTFPIDVLENIIIDIEIYALQSFNVTAQHKANVKALETIEDLMNYDFTTDYPAKLNFE